MFGKGEAPDEGEEVVNDGEVDRVADLLVSKLSRKWS